jgi:uncharacterized protein with PIN domain
LNLKKKTTLATASQELLCRKLDKMKFYRIKIYCANCHTHLYDYDKDMVGHLIKCYKERIVTDYTKGDLTCPNCGEVFAREAMYHGMLANKIIQGKVYHKGHC